MAFHSPCGIFDMTTPGSIVRDLSVHLSWDLSVDREGVAGVAARHTQKADGVSSAHRKLLQVKWLTLLSFQDTE
jgi:hypothetical protein